MALFVFIGTDGPEARALRPRVRPNHLTHWQPLDAAGRVRFGGPLLDEAGNPGGSVLIFDAPDIAAARAHAASDPYVIDGVFARWEIHETRAVFPSA